MRRLVHALGTLPFLFLLVAPAEAAWQVTQDLKLTAPTPAAEAAFGSALALDGDTLLVGAIGAAPGGAAHVRSRDAGGAGAWGAVALLTPSDGAAGDEFGWALDLDGDLAVVGAREHDAGGSDAGAVYVFHRDAGGAGAWGQIAKITAPDAAAGDLFGSAVAVAGDLVAVGAPRDDDDGERSGAVYLFGRNVGGPEAWALVRKLGASDAAAQSDFGAVLALDGDTLVVGAPGDDGEASNAGAAYVFGRNWGGANQWGELRKLVAGDAAATWSFGEAVALDGDLIVVGSPFHDGLGNLAGAAYVFGRDTGGAQAWGSLAQLFASDGETAGYFGDAVAVAGDLVAVGSPGDNDGGGFAGAVFLYLRDQGGPDGFGEVKKATASDPAWQDYLGLALALEGADLFAAAPSDDDGASNSGSVYHFLFSCPNDAWGPECQACPGGGTPCSGHGACDDGFAGSGLCTCEAGWRSGDCGEAAPLIEYAAIQFPETPVTVAQGSLADFYGRLYVDGVTGPAGQGPGVRAQWGYGPDGSDPSVDPSGWSWIEALYNGDLEVDDEYVVVTDATPIGTWDWCFRFSTDEGASWTYADNLPLGNLDGYDPGDTGALTVNAVPESCGDGVDNDADGLVDCDDPDCDADPACALPAPDYATIQWPGGPVTVWAGLDFTSFGRVHVPGRTEAPGRATGITAQWGHGPAGTNPTVDPTGWQWFLADFSRDIDNDDEYVHVASGLAVGEHAFAWRFSADGGASWLYGDDYPEGSTNGYDPATSGRLTVAWPPVLYVAIDHPTAPVTADYGDSITTRGRVYVEHFTEGVGQGPGIRGQFGYGPEDSDPALAAGWLWVEGSYFADVLNGWGDLHDDQYIATATGVLPGSYSWAWRFSTDEGASWRYGDNFPGGTYDGYSPATAGSLVVTAPPEICDDGIDNDVDGDTDCDDADCALFCVCETVSCNDGDACTIDSCTPGVGCVFTPIPGCSDGRDCAGAVASLTIDAPVDSQRFELGYFEWTPELQGNVTLTFSFTAPDPATDRLVIAVDDEAPLVLAPASSHVLADLAAGSHTVAVRLTNAAGKPYCGARDGVRFYVSRVCMDNDDCDDADPCLTDRCIAQSGLGGWVGRCRFGLDPSDPGCCVNGNWCDQLGLSFGEAPLPYLCADVDGDGVGDCVQCVTGADCLITSPCQMGAVCVDNECQYTIDPNCCESDLDCDDANPCTADTCDLGANACVFTPIEGCCLAGQEEALPGAPGFGCTPAEAHPCVRHVCIGQGAAATCKQAQIWRQCCAADEDCDTPRYLTACVDPTERGYARCDLSQVPDPSNPAAHVCDYDDVDPLCCTHDWQCGDRYPAELGTCTDLGGDYRVCQYAPNPDYCASPVTKVLVSELMIDTSGLVDPDGEWFELFNPTGVDVDVAGWTVAGDALGSESFVITPTSGSLVIPAGGTITLAASSAPEVNGGFVPDHVYDPLDFRLDNEDAIFLFDALGDEQDRVVWDATWLLWAPNESMALISPYLDNALATSWAKASLNYGTVATVVSRGTPGGANRDVFDDSQTSGGPCDDANPCTLDLCHYSQGNVCAHLPLFDCCLSQNSECVDYNACTLDTCDIATFRCQHAPVEGCCTSDTDCVGVYPLPFDTAAEQAAFDLCGVALCLGGQCRFGRNLNRPGCCVSTDAELGYGCKDRNICTVDACTEDAGGSGGNLYPACTFDADPDGDGTDECCATAADCDDGDPATIDICSRVADNPDCPGVGQSECCHLPNPAWCTTDAHCDDGLDCTTDRCCTGVGAPLAACTAANTCANVTVPDHPTAGACCETAGDCADGDACTSDLCCEGFGNPVPECAAANTCVHRPVAEASCCDSHDDCRGVNKPAAMFCREGYCIGGVCRFAPPAEPDCCVVPSDCAHLDPTGCTHWVCSANECVGTPQPGCCQTAAQCPAPASPCAVAACQAGACVELELPGCCVDEDPLLPDDECEDGNPCTTDHCMDVGGGKYQCRHFNTGGVSCCATDTSCPDDRVQCTVTSCSDEHRCELTGQPACVVTSPYTMTFTEGHAAYAGQYTDLSVFGWSVGALADGVHEALDASSWQVGSGALLGPDQFLRFSPVGGSPGVPSASCALLPALDLTGGFYAAALSFHYAVDQELANAALDIRIVTSGPVPAQAWQQPLDLGVDVAETAYSTGRAALPFAVAESGRVQFALCVTATSYTSLELAIDDIHLERFRTP